MEPFFPKKVPNLSRTVLRTPYPLESPFLRIQILRNVSFIVNPSTMCLMSSIYTVLVVKICVSDIQTILRPKRWRSSQIYRCICRPASDIIHWSTGPSKRRDAFLNWSASLHRFPDHALPVLALLFRNASLNSRGSLRIGNSTHVATFSIVRRMP
jgi:hypothetical protein